MHRCLPWLLGIVFFLSTAWAAEPPLEEIRALLRTHLPVPPEESRLAALGRDNLERELKDIDPYARLFTREELRKPAPGNQWVGIGGELFSRDGQLIISPYQEGSLARSGVTQRVVVLEINARRAEDLSLQEAAAMLLGPPGSKVRLLLRDFPQGEEFEKILLRRSFRPLQVEMLQPGDRAVLRVRSFEAGRTRSALKAGIEFIGAGQALIIIDLRESGGGDLYEALDCASMFLSPGTSLGGVQRRDSRVVVSSPGEKKITSPVILLVGPDTASAAEVFAAALGHHGRAVLVGRSTFGKCTTQTRISLSDGSVLQLTNGLILAPEGDRCSTAGLQPHIAVPEKNLFDTAWLVRRGLEGLTENALTGMPGAEYSLERLAGEGRLTVRSMRAWDRLPVKYVRLVLDLLELDLDLLGADTEQVKKWADMAADSNDPALARHAQELESLAGFMSAGGWKEKH